MTVFKGAGPEPCCDVRGEGNTRWTDSHSDPATATPWSRHSRPRYAPGQQHRPAHSRKSIKILLHRGGRGGHKMPDKLNVIQRACELKGLGFRVRGLECRV